MEEAKLRNLHQTLVHLWSMPPVEAERMDWETLLDALSRRVTFLIEHDFERLLTSMYMVDVSEARFAEAVKRPPEEDPARAVAKLILERETQKMASRLRYARPENKRISSRVEEEDSG